MALPIPGPIPVAAGTAVDLSDNFSTNPLTSRWSDLWGASVWNGSATFGAASGSYAKYNTAVGGVNQYGKFTIASSDPDGGCIFRSTGTASDGFYIGVVLNGGDVYFSRGSSTGWLADMGGASALTIAEGDTVAMTLTGTGAETTLRVWKNTTANIPDSVSSWDSRAADITKTASGGVYYDTGNYIGVGIDASYNIDNWYGGSL